jgi:hypothetical protein
MAVSPPRRSGDHGAFVGMKSSRRGTATSRPHSCSTFASASTVEANVLSGKRRQTARDHVTDPRNLATSRLHSADLDSGCSNRTWS